MADSVGQFETDSRAALDKARQTYGKYSLGVQHDTAAMTDTAFVFERGMDYVATTTTTAMGHIGSVWHGMSYDIRSDSTITKQTVEGQFSDLTDYVKGRFTDKQLTDLLSGKGSMGHELVADLGSNKADIIEKAGEIVSGMIGRMTRRNSRRSCRARARWAPSSWPS